jgi:hypothetical protein
MQLLVNTSADIDEIALAVLLGVFAKTVLAEL